MPVCDVARHYGVTVEERKQEIIVNARRYHPEMFPALLKMRGKNPDYSQKEGRGELFNRQG
jgi:hypothetical protein